MKDKSIIRPQESSTRSNVSRAFTLIELLVVIAVIGILAALLLPALAAGKARAQQATCINNLHQLAVAFQLYVGEHDDQFPGSGSLERYGPRPEDWIWWQQDRDINQSSIARYVGKFTPKLFTCPLDKAAISLQSQGFLLKDPYRYSFTLTSYDLSNGVNLGMSLLVTKDDEVYPFKGTWIKSPSIKIMMIEEDRKTINDGRWHPKDLVASRHSQGRGDVTFADGHVEKVTPKFSLNPTNSNPTF